jgi:hypothetical protein
MAAPGAAKAFVSATESTLPMFADSVANVAISDCESKTELIA